MKNKLPNINSNTGRFIDGNPATGTLGTIVTAEWLNGVQERVQDVFEELRNVLLLGNLQPDEQRQNQVAEAIKAYCNNINLKVQSNTRNFDNYIPNSKKSNAVDSNSADSVATSVAVKAAYDKGVEAKTAADNAILLSAQKQNALVETIVNLEGLDSNKWYPILMYMPDVSRSYRFGVWCVLGESRPVWSSHHAGFGVQCEWHTIPSGWGVWDIHRVIDTYQYVHCDKSPVLNIGQIREQSKEYVLLRGGAKYKMYCEPGVIVETTDGRDYHQTYHGVKLSVLVIDNYNEQLVPKPLRLYLDDIANKANKANRLIDYGINDFVLSEKGQVDARTLNVDGIYSFGDHAVNGPMRAPVKIFNIAGGRSSWGHQLAFEGYTNNIFISARRAENSKDWTDWERLLTTKDLVVKRKSYQRTIRGTSVWDNGNIKDISVTGTVCVHADGTIVQHIYLSNVRIKWFEQEPAILGSSSRSIEIPLQLWTAMPNKVTWVDAQISKTMDTSIFGLRTTGEEAAQWSRPIWAHSSQDSASSLITLHTHRTYGSGDETVDLYVKVEGY